MLKIPVSGDTYLYARKGEYGTMYSVQLSRKLQDGTWENGYMNAQFKKDTPEIPNGSKIDIKNGWVTFYKGKDNKTNIYVFISDFEILEEGKPRSSEGFQVVETEEKLPF